MNDWVGIIAACLYDTNKNIYNVRRATYHLKVEYEASQTPVSEGFINKIIIINKTFAN